MNTSWTPLKTALAVALCGATFTCAAAYAQGTPAAAAAAKPATAL